MTDKKSDTESKDTASKPQLNTKSQRRAKVGEDVFFNTGYHDQQYRKKPTVLPAKVVFVQGDGAVNLAVFTDEGYGIEVKRGIRLADPSLDLSQEAAPNTFSFENREPAKVKEEDDPEKTVIKGKTDTPDSRESQEDYEARKKAEDLRNRKAERAGKEQEKKEKADQ